MFISVAICLPLPAPPGDTCRLHSLILLLLKIVLTTLQMGILYQTEKFPDCVHFSGALARQGVIETVAVVYELTKGTQEKLFADWAQ